MQIICHINRDIYKVVTPNICTDEVIITTRQIDHIKERHPTDYERFSGYFAEVLVKPDYILRDTRLNTAIVLKEITVGGEKLKLVLRLCTPEDPETYKNSIITAQKVENKRYQRYLRNAETLYCRVDL